MKQIMFQIYNLLSLLDKGFFLKVPFVTLTVLNYPAMHRKVLLCPSRLDPLTSRLMTSQHQTPQASNTLLEKRNRKAY